jgi:hypothetical protein
MMFLRFTRSERIPPKGERRMVGITAMAVTVPKTAADPVASRTYRARAKRRIAFPNREMSCPMATRVKSRLKSFWDMRGLLQYIWLVCN